MISIYTAHLIKQAIALMLGCAVPASSWTPNLSFIAINEGTEQRGYDRSRVFEIM